MENAVTCTSLADEFTEKAEKSQFLALRSPVTSEKQIDKDKM